MYEWILFVLIVALLLYVILAGADFGAGILELFTSRKYREEMEGITYQAIGPVWEANHIWLILIIVILFNGFPKTYALISTYLHLPIMLMLIGIVFRGTAFAFRHYDAIRDRSHRVYSSAFTMASFLTPLFLGSIAGATILGRLRTTPTDFLSGYIWPWFNPFSLSLGLMTSALFAFLAATFLIGETEDGSNLQQRVIRQAVMALGATVLLGGVVFLSGELAGFSLAGRFLEHPLSLIGVGLATLGLGLFLAVLRKKRW
nr:cytochrome d ubiquinol oxidase subunit II [Calditrichia bacterium]